MQIMNIKKLEIEHLLILNVTSHKSVDEHGQSLYHAMIININNEDPNIVKECEGYFQSHNLRFLFCNRLDI